LGIVVVGVGGVGIATGLITAVDSPLDDLKLPRRKRGKERSAK
jgi:hypothetical protein